MATHTSTAATSSHPLALDVVMFAALLSTAVALGGALAHLFELPNKIGLQRDEYFVVQQIYRGWAQLAYVLAVQLASLIGAAIAARRRPAVLRFVLLALLFMAGSQVVFWIFTYPANAATENWTRIPENWAELRAQWEYSHAAGAGLQVSAMCALILASLARARE